MDSFKAIAEATRQTLLALDVDPTTDGMKGTPERVARMWHEMTVGYRTDPAKLLQVTFSSQEYDQMIVLRDIEFFSTCEHHMLPFSGRAWVGYIPQKGKVVGISKLARLVDCFARRFQIQERMTAQIANALHEHLDPVGVGVVLRASHLCMVCRGAMKPGATMETTALMGAMRENPSARAEFLRSVTE